MEKSKCGSSTNTLPLMGALTSARKAASGDHRGRPFVTDITRGWRTEFTGELFEQWVNKTANYLESEFGSGVRLHVNMRACWLWPVLVAALDEIEGCFTSIDTADAIMMHGVLDHPPCPVLAVNDHPMAMPFPHELPAKHLDFFREVRGGADARGSGPVHSELLVDNADARIAADIAATLSPLEANIRIAVTVPAGPVDALWAVEQLSLTPWLSRGSLVITDGSSRLESERVDVTR